MHHSHSSSTHQTSMHQHKICMHRMLFNYQTITHKSPLNWDFNPTRHHPASTFKTRNKTNFFLNYCTSITIEVSLSQKIIFVTTENLRRDCSVAPGLVARPDPFSRTRSVSCHTARCVSCGRRVVRVAHPISFIKRALCAWLAYCPGWVVTCLSRDPKNQFSAQFWSVHSITNISTVDPKILRLNTRAIHGPEEPKLCH